MFINFNFCPCDLSYACIGYTSNLQYVDYYLWPSSFLCHRRRWLCWHFSTITFQLVLSMLQVLVEQRPDKAGLGSDVVLLPTADPKAKKKTEVWKKAQKRFQELDDADDWNATGYLQHFRRIYILNNRKLNYYLYIIVINWLCKFSF